MKKITIELINGKVVLREPESRADVSTDPKEPAAPVDAQAFIKSAVDGIVRRIKELSTETSSNDALIDALLRAMRSVHQYSDNKLNIWRDAVLATDIDEAYFEEIQNTAMNQAYHPVQLTYPQKPFDNHQFHNSFYHNPGFVTHTELKTLLSSAYMYLGVNAPSCEKKPEVVRACLQVLQHVEETLKKYTEQKFLFQGLLENIPPEKQEALLAALNKPGYALCYERAVRKYIADKLFLPPYNHQYKAQAFKLLIQDVLMFKDVDFLIEAAKVVSSPVRHPHLTHNSSPKRPVLAAYNAAKQNTSVAVDEPDVQMCTPPRSQPINISKPPAIQRQRFDQSLFQ